MTLFCIAVPPLSPPSISSGLNTTSTSLAAGRPWWPFRLRTYLSVASSLLGLILITDPPLHSSSTRLAAGCPGRPQRLRTWEIVATPLLGQTLMIDSCLDSAAACFGAGGPRRPQELGLWLRCCSYYRTFFSFYPFKNLNKVCSFDLLLLIILSSPAYCQ